MKIFSIIVILVLGVSLQAQEIDESRKSMVNGSQNAISIEIGDGDYKFVEKEWKEYLKTYGKQKSVKKSDEKIVENVRILSVMGTESFNLYSRLEEGSNSSKLIVWAQVNDEEYISSTSNLAGYDGLVEFLKEFDFSVRKNRMAIDVEEQERMLVQYEKSLKKLEGNNDKLHTLIEKAKESIAKAEKDIEANLIEQADTKVQIETQKDTVDKAKKKHGEMKRES